ncbi:DUF4124 domain-containing protein [Methylomonas sp. MgM2]
MRTKFYSLALISSLLLVLANDSYAKKRLYRWVDDEGNVTVSDQVPPDQVQHKRETLNEKAQVLDVVERAKSPEELAREIRLEELRKEQEKIIAKQAATDKLLLATYRNLDDMNKALENKLALLDNQKRIIEGNKSRLEQQLFQQQHQAANLERNGQNIPEKLLIDIAATRQQIELTAKDLQRHEFERQAIEREFRGDIARFEFLTRDYNDISNTQRSLAASNANNELGLFVCQDAGQCERAWKFAAEFVAKFATTGGDIETDKLIMTAAPVNDTDFSLSASKLERNGTQQIFLDIHCKASNIGRELCAGEKAQAIRRSFSPYIQLHLSSSMQ